MPTDVGFKANPSAAVTAVEFHADQVTIDGKLALVERVKVVVGDPGSGADVSAANPLPVTQADRTSALSNGRKTVTAPGTPVALAASTPCKWVTITALPSNTRQVNIGAAGVTSVSGSDTGVPMLARDSVTIPVADVALPVNTVKGAVADFFTTRVALGGAGAHSLVVAWQSGAGVYIDGVIEYNGDENAGIRLYEAGHYGWTSVDYETTLDTPGANGNPLATQIAAVQPQLVVIGLSTNDYLHFLSSAGLSTSLLALIATIRANCAVPPSIVLSPPYLTNYQTFGGHAQPLEPWANYLAVANAIADADTGVTVCNHSLRMPPVAGDVLALYNDNFHPKDKGHAMMADTLSGFLAAA